MRELLGGLPAGARRDVRLTVDEFTARATASYDGSQVNFKVSAKINRPGVPYEILKLVQAEKKPFKVTFSETPWSELSAWICWLKSAYLTLFASAGYTVVFADAMHPVRKQILEPETSHIPRWGLELPEQIPDAFRRRVRVEKPEWQRGWFVQSGRNVVVLPDPEGSSGRARSGLRDGRLP